MQIKAGDVDIRFINGYGPQECDNKINVNSFWQEIEIAIESAKEENCLVILQMDANAKLGKHISLEIQMKCLRMGRFLMN